ncbi:hypothetical protein [Candidatus Halobonum tyrrellensis]|uniref:Uncharacterized protein n=1 Tax=Candidatus Halobonum tyrrellensis G22 TaxID=1324957 RepID=V4H875_9EURY|nr:hypothetical protein [Candidatus Halobonum tyrrellensis]ESP86880.1 hypothetical protein K933_16502 [Candidatus Halobonum tyrrellensis G22]
MGSVIDRLPTSLRTKKTDVGALEDDIEEELDSNSQMGKVRMLMMTGQALYFWRKGRKVDSLLLLAAVFIAPKSGRAAYLINTAVTLNTLRKYLKGQKK